MPSTVIQDHSYDPETGTLFITFRSGELYAYLNVEPKVWLGLNRAFSKGRYFAGHIRDRYEFHRMTEINPAAA